MATAMTARGDIQTDRSDVMDAMGKRKLSVMRASDDEISGPALSPITTMKLGLLDPLVSRVRQTNDLRCHRHDRLPARSVLPGIVQNHATGTLTHFGGKLVLRLAHDVPSCSGVGASDKPGAVHQKPDRILVELLSGLVLREVIHFGLGMGLSPFNAATADHACGLQRRMDGTWSFDPASAHFCNLAQLREVASQFWTVSSVLRLRVDRHGERRT